MKALHAQLPFRWPFPPAPKPRMPATGRRGRSRPQAVAHRSHTLSRKAMLLDVLLVIFWGASIPGLMWLAAAGGF